MSQESFLRLSLLVRVKGADLSLFDRGQNLVTRQLTTSIFEIVRLMVCSVDIVVSTYLMWVNDCETISKKHRV